MPETVTPFPGRREEPSSDGALEAERDQRLQLGDWLFEPSLNRLSRGDEIVRIEPQVASLLSFLTRYPGRVVSKEEIVQSVWEGRFIADSALTRTMAELRRALGDDAHEPRYIETISKRGYRLLVEAVPAAEGPRAGTRAGLYALLAFAGLVLSALGVYLVTLVTDRNVTSEAATAAISSVVVLPLEDLSLDREGEYFAASMTEALTTDLARLGSFRVLSRRAVEQYLSENGALSGVATGLGADAAVEGSIVRTDGRVRISVQLIDAASETHLWAGSYERDFVDVLSLQREVARAIAAELSSSAALGFGASEPAGSPPQVDPVAHDLYLQGRHLLNRVAWEGANGAAEQLERALAIDPSFALAHASLAEYYSKITLFDFLKPHEGFPLARAAAHRALEIDSELAEAHAAAAWVEFLFDWDWEEAETGFRRALALNPSHARVRRGYSFFLTCMGRFAEAEAEARRELELDPLIGVGHLAWVLFNAGRYAESLDVLEGPTKPGGKPYGSAVRGWSLALLGRYDEAVAALEETLRSRGGDDAVNLGILGWTYALAGRVDEARETLRELESLAAQQTSGDLYPQVIIHLALGDSERALDLLEQAVLQRSPNTVFLAVEPFLEPLHDRPRFQRLLASVGLPSPAVQADGRTRLE